MFCNILLPVDFTEKNEPAIAIALDLARQCGASEGTLLAAVNLLHVVETVEHVEFEEMADFYRQLEARAVAKLMALVERFAAAGVRARYDVLFGRRPDTILNQAAELRCDLIVLSSFQVDRDHPALGLGTISYKVAILARCPVLLVK